MDIFENNWLKGGYYHPDLDKGQFDLFTEKEFKELTKNGPIFAKCTLGYPFDKPYEMAVIIDNLEHTIEQVYAGMVYKYSDATIKDIPGLYNKRVKSKFGNSIHDIGDLVLEGLYYDSNNNTLNLLLGS